MCNSFTCSRCGADLSKPHMWNGQVYGPECIKIVSGGKATTKKSDKSVYAKIDSLTLKNVAEGTTRTQFTATVQGVEFKAICYTFVEYSDQALTIELYQKALNENATPFHIATKIAGWLMIIDTDGSPVWKNVKYDKDAKTVETLADYGRVKNTIKL